MSVFNRDSLKVIRNTTQAKNLTTFHGVYLNERFDDERYINILYCYLLTPTCHRLLRINKREYGGGLDKFEPNDLNNALIIDISSISNEDSIKILTLYDQLKKESNKMGIIGDLDAIFESYLS